VLDAFADREDVRMRCLHVIVDDDTAFHFDASFMAKPDVRANTSGNHHEIRGNASCAFELDALDFPVSENRGGAQAQ
jgi:hypothetical protein